MFHTLQKNWTAVSKDLTLSSRECVLCFTACACGAIACAMTGMVIGMLISPRKAVTIGSHNGSNNTLPQLRNPLKGKSPEQRLP